MDTQTQLQMLACPPAGEQLDIVIDSDTFNEIDDQFAIAYALRSPERFQVLALHAAPFFSREIPTIAARAASPAEGMRKSYDEMLRILELLGESQRADQVFLGSERYLADEQTPVESPAAKNLIALAGAHTPEHPLYVVSIGAITNVASALLMAPEIAERMVVVWLGGQALTWPENDEFNLIQDIAAARVVFGSGVPVVHLPCKGVVSHFRISRAELERYLGGANELCDYLIDIACREAKAAYGRDEFWSRTIWDVTPFAWLVNPAWCPSYLTSSPIPEYDRRWARDERRHPIRSVYFVRRDEILADLAAKLTRTDAR